MSTGQSRWSELRGRLQRDYRDAEAKGYEGVSCYFDRWAAYIAGLEAEVEAASAVPHAIKDRSHLLAIDDGMDDEEEP